MRRHSSPCARVCRHRRKRSRGVTGRDCQATVRFCSALRGMTRASGDAHRTHSAARKRLEINCHSNIRGPKTRRDPQPLTQRLLSGCAREAQGQDVGMGGDQSTTTVVPLAIVAMQVFHQPYMPHREYRILHRCSCTSYRQLRHPPSHEIPKPTAGRRRSPTPVLIRLTLWHAYCPSRAEHPMLSVPPGTLLREPGSEG